MSCSDMTASCSRDSTSGRANPRWNRRHQATHQLAMLGGQQGGQRHDDPPAQAGLLGVDLHRVGVLQNVRASDVEGPRRRNRRVGRLGEVVQGVVDRDRLNLVAHPLRGGHHRQSVVRWRTISKDADPDPMTMPACRTTASTDDAMRLRRPCFATVGGGTTRPWDAGPRDRRCGVRRPSRRRRPRCARPSPLR